MFNLKSEINSKRFIRGKIINASKHIQAVHRRGINEVMQGLTTSQLLLEIEQKKRSIFSLPLFAKIKKRGV